MVFRNFDTWDNYLDKERNLLRGCVMFLLKDGSTVANIYDSDESPLANPQITDIYGRTEHQVFVESAVRAYMYKYIGQGSLADEQEHGIDVSDVTKWVLQYTVESESIDHKEVEGDSAMGVSNMDALRAIDPYEVPEVDGTRIVCLYGYYESGDAEPVYYIWEEESEQPDDNGSVIMSNGSLVGRWRMIQPTEHCDSRHFGVFPQDSASASVDHATGITQLFEYCNLCGIKPFFNGNLDYPYFIYSSINVSSKQNIDVSNDTVFVDNAASTMYGNFDIEAKFKFKNANTAINSKKVRTSWHFKSCTGYDTVVIDSTTPQNAFSDADVYVTNTTVGKTFTRCRFYSNGKLGANTFSACELKEVYFTSENVSATIDANCRIDIDDFSSTKFWLRLMEQTPATVYDLRYHVVNSNCVANKDNIYWKNAAFDSFTYTPTTSTVLEGCKGVVAIVTANNPTITIEDSEISIAMNAEYLPTIAATNSSLQFTQMCTFNEAVFKNCSLNGMTYFNVANGLTLRNTEVALPIGVGGAIDCVGCVIHSILSQISNNAVIYLNFVNNEVIGAFAMSSNIPGTIVSANISNNHGVNVVPFTIDRTNIDLDDSHHAYTYSGNTGTFLPESTQPKAVNLTVRTCYSLYGVTTKQRVSSLGTLSLVKPWQIDSDRDETSAGVFTWGGNYFDTAQFFRIGTSSFRVYLILNFPSAKYISFPVKQILQADFVDGYTWKFTTPLQSGSWSGDGLYNYPSKYSTVAIYGLSSGSGSTLPDDYTMYAEVQYEMLDRHP